MYKLTPQYVVSYDQVTSCKGFCVDIVVTHLKELPNLYLNNFICVLKLFLQPQALQKNIHISFNRLGVAYIKLLYAISGITKTSIMVFSD